MMHYVYIICFGLIFGKWLGLIVPPCTVKWAKYHREHCDKKAIEREALIMGIICLIISFKMAIVFVNWLGW